MVAITLAICTFRFQTHGDLPIFEVWTGFVRILTWRLPEEVRVVYATISFTWVCVILLFGGTTPVNSETTEAAMDGIADPFASLP
jgi:hypothetical protein